jgi:hypothetical protein
VPEPSCTTRKLVKFAVVLWGHLPNITLCTTRNSHSCYGLKVPRRRPNPLRLFSRLARRRPDKLRLFSHFSRIGAPGVRGKPQLKQRPAMPSRNGRWSASPSAGTREEADDRAGRGSARQGAESWGAFRRHQAGRAAILVPHAFRNNLRLAGQADSNQGIICRLASAWRPRSTTASGLKPLRPPAPMGSDLQQQGE